MADTKRRTANYSNNEKKVLSELVMKYKNVVENKRTDASTNSQKQSGWIRIAQEFNSISTECYRTPNNLKTCWENIKRATKKQVSSRKKEMFMTGGGKPQPSPSSDANVIVEAVLGPSLEGLSNIYDCDGPDFNNSSEQQATTELNDIVVPNWSPMQTGCDSEPEIIVIIEEEKENNCTPDMREAKSATNPKSEELWETWTPKSLKKPIAEPLRSNNSQNNWVKRRRPKMECSADTLLKSKIELVEILKKNAEEEGKLKELILREQLKQEVIKTETLSKLNQI